MRKLIERVRRSNGVLRWPWRMPDAQQRVAFLPPPDRTGYTVHRDVVLRLRNLSIDVREPLSDRGPEADAFKIRVARSPKARREASSLVRKRYAGRGYLTSATLVNAHACTFSAYDEGRLSGTVSLRLDSEDGLAADELFRNEMIHSPIAAKLERRAGNRKGGALARNLYEHGFSKAEAEGILGRLRKLDAG